MKLLRYGPPGRERPGLIDASGVIRDLSGHLEDIRPETLSPAGLAELAAIDPKSLPTVASDVRLGVPFSGARKYLAIGLNYADHAAESNMAVPTEPVVFMKAITCLQGPDDEVVMPRGATKTDWEVELGIVIGTEASYVDEADALAHVAGYVLLNDLSERAFQLDRGGTWDKGKGCDTFGPVGPWLVTRDDVADVHNLGIWLEVNERRVQDGNTRTMIFRVPHIVSYLSQFMTLQPGDIIATGTPPGVGLGQKPEPWYLKAGDRMRLGIEGLGEQRQTVVAWRPPARAGA
jgi:2-keto-4-pentenoate hydratase/2-oxohepta-3-ene-1,7-dioic acid hydratase in catechol pathway